MKKIILLVLLLAGCGAKTGEAEQTIPAGRDYNVGKLFTVEGCTVYRFEDGHRNRYFTNCSGSTQWAESCGKNCTRDAGVYGGGR